MSALDVLLANDSRTVWIANGGTRVHLTLKCKILKPGKYKAFSLLAVKAKTTKPHICQHCLKILQRS